MRISRWIIAIPVVVMLSAQALLYSQEENKSNLSKQTLFISVEDSIDLATDLYFPGGSGPFPCILIRSPYSKNNIEINGEGTVKQFLIRGWVVVVQDTRGKFESNGMYEPFRHERPDGLSTLEWIRSQTWSNDKVAGWYDIFLMAQIRDFEMMGPSWHPASRPERTKKCNISPNLCIYSYSDLMYI